MEYPHLFFVPLFYVLDKGRGRVLAVKSQDRYELKGVWLEFDDASDDMHEYHASLNVQAFNEYPARWDFTKEEDMALSFVAEIRPKLTEEACNLRYSADFYKY